MKNLIIIFLSVIHQIILAARDGSDYILNKMKKLIFLCFFLIEIEMDLLQFGFSQLILNKYLFLNLYYSFFSNPSDKSAGKGWIGQQSLIFSFIVASGFIEISFVFHSLGFNSHFHYLCTLNFIISI